jgi:hypothetical protein
VGHRLVQRRVERVAGCPDGPQAELLQHAFELVGNRLERTGEIAVLAGPLDVVQHRQQPGQDSPGRAVDHHDPVAVDPLAVVGVLGGDPLQVRGAFG